MRVFAATVANLGVRVSGVAREIAFAGAFGAGPEADALNAALRVPNLFRDVFAEGAFAHAFVPTFAQVSAERGDAEGWRLFNAVLLFAGLGTGAVALSGIAFPSLWVHLVAHGFDADKQREMATLVQAATPFLVGLSLAAVAGGALTVRGRIVPAVAAPAVVNVLVIGACLLAPVFAMGVRPIVLVALATTAGGLLAAIAQVPALWSEGWRPAVVTGHPDVRRLVTFVLPALLGILAVQATNLVDVQLAARLGDGAVSHVTYALRVIQLPMHLFAGSVATAAIAATARAVAEGRADVGRAAAVRSVGLVAFLVAPVSIVLLLRGPEVVSLVLERGWFTPRDTTAVGALVAVYAVSGVAVGLHRLLVPTLFAWGDARSPLIASFAMLALRVPLSIYAADPHRLGVLGIAGAHALATIAEVVVLFLLLDRRAGGLTRPVSGDLARTALATLAMGAWLFATPTWSLWWTGVPAGLLYLAIAALLGSRHVRELARRAAPPPPPVAP